MNEEIKFSHRLPIHEFGTLNSLTRWINKHEEGFSEWIKNVRAAYQEDRANVTPEHRVAILLFRDKTNKEPARLGILDVGGLTFEDVKSWSVWNDPEASSRGKQKQEETQGNGGKAYMYRLFRGPAFILGVKNNKRNQAGFIGKNNTLGRGLPRFYPSSEKEIWQIWQSGDKINPDEKEKDVSVDWEHEIVEQLKNFDTDLASLPIEVKDALRERKSFTLVQGIDPINWEETDIKQFIKQILHHPQSTMALQQVKFYAMHNGKLLFKGSALELEKIEPYPGFEGPFECEIPETLLTPNSNQVSTTKSSSGKHPKGKIILYTSKDSMEASYRTLKPRWAVTYQTKYEIVGKKSISEIVPTTPGSHFIYATVNLDALTPDSVDAGRKRPNDTNLVLAVDKFLTEKIGELAKKINDLQKQELNESILDEIEKENEFLNKITYEFLPPEGGQDFGDVIGESGNKRKRKRGPIEYGNEPNEIKVSTYSIRIAKGVSINLSSVLYPTIRDKNSKAVNLDLIWMSDEKKIIKLDKDGNCMALEKGECKIYIKVKNTKINTPPIVIEVITIKDVILSPRELTIGVGHSKQVISQVTSDDGKRYSDVLLDWKHDAADQNIIKVSPKGYVFGNKIGKTLIKAGVNSISNVWAVNPVSVEIVPTDEKGESGSGFPTLKITGRDIDPYTGKIREGDPEAPALWQEIYDVKNNIWWLNTQSKDAQFAYKQRESGNIQLWRFFHARIRFEMVIQAHLQCEYTKKGEGEQPALWSDHKSFYERKYVELAQAMWERLSNYVMGNLELIK
jgi:hypothetical protein